MNFLLFHLQTFVHVTPAPQKMLKPDSPDLLFSLSMNYLSRLYLHIISRLCSAMHSLHTLCSSYWFTRFALLSSSFPLGGEELPGGKDSSYPSLCLVLYILHLGSS